MEQDKIQELIINSKKGDTKSFGILVGEYQSLVFRLSFRLLCNEEDAKDTVQDVFVKVWLQLKKYDSRYRFSTWIYKITCNMCYDRLRFVQRRPESIEIQTFAAECNAVSSDNPETSVINSELKKFILHFTGDLSPKQKLVFTLSDIEELETEEISVITGLTAGQIKSNLHLARKYIKNKINRITL
jgi:RNA polymerase sigma-70 factor (ECF subfamily)